MTVSVQVITLRELAEDLRQYVDKWLCALGFRKHDRLRELIDLVEQAADGIDRARATGDPSKIGRIDSYHFGIAEAAELRDIWRAFQEADSAVLKPILQRGLRGPLRPLDESKGTADARNMMFQLALGAEWKLGGASVEIGEPDIVLKCSDTPLMIECKRPFRQHSIRPNVKGAAEQIADKIKQSASASGLIAISVSRVLDSGRLLYVSKSNTAITNQWIGDTVANLFKDESRRWRKEWFDTRIVGVLFHARVIAVTNDHPVHRVSTTIFAPLPRRQAAFDLLETELRRIYPDSIRID